MLIDSSRLTEADRRHWEMMARLDEMYWRASLHHIDDRASEAMRAIAAFAAAGDGYIGVSWGKDSVVVADLALRAGIDWPLVYVRVRGRDNPDAPLVRDAALARWGHPEYHEIEAARLHPGGVTGDGEGPDGFTIAAQRWGRRYISGVRAAESRARARRMRSYGIATATTCAPIGWWPDADVWAYLHGRDLPIHPAYACSFGGALSRARIRVAAIGGQRGTGRGRAEWERHYYPEIARRDGRWPHGRG